MESTVAKIGLVIMVLAVLLRFLLAPEQKKELYNVFSELRHNNLETAKFAEPIQKERITKRAVLFKRQIKLLPSKNAVLASSVEEENSEEPISSDYVNRDDLVHFTPFNNTVEVQHEYETEWVKPLEDQSTITTNLSLFFPEQ